MPLPNTIRVKLSSEAAEYVALTPVVVREMPLIELLEQIVSATGPDPSRVEEILRRGSVVSGATRFRWERLDATPEDLAPLLARLPAPDPSRAFNPAQCVSFSLCGPGVRIHVTAEAAQRKRLLLRTSFWTALLNALSDFAYVSYIHKDRADLYRASVDAETASHIGRNARLLPYSDLAAQIAAARITSIEFLVRRAGSGSSA